MYLNEQKAVSVPFWIIMQELDIYSLVDSTNKCGFELAKEGLAVVLEGTHILQTRNFPLGLILAEVSQSQIWCW